MCSVGVDDRHGKHRGVHVVLDVTVVLVVDLFRDGPHVFAVPAPEIDRSRAHAVYSALSYVQSVRARTIRILNSSNLCAKTLETFPRIAVRGWLEEAPLRLGGVFGDFRERLRWAAGGAPTLEQRPPFYNVLAPKGAFARLAYKADVLDGRPVRIVASPTCLSCWVAIQVLACDAGSAARLVLPGHLAVRESKH